MLEARITTILKIFLDQDMPTLHIKKNTDYETIKEVEDPQLEKLLLELQPAQSQNNILKGNIKQKYLAT